MASPDDDIFINTGTTFQQQYVARVPTIGHVPASGQQTFRQPTVGQSHYTFAARNPFTYTRQGNKQTHYIANRQNAYPYIAAGQQPYIANRQNAYPYIANSQTPYIANKQNAYPYIAAGQQPYIANAQSPFTYQRQNPFTYRNPVNGQQHYIANARTPARVPYQVTVQSTVQSPVRAPARTPAGATDQITVTETDYTSASTAMAFSSALEIDSGYIEVATAKMNFSLSCSEVGSGATAIQTLKWFVSKGAIYQTNYTNTFNASGGNVTLTASPHEVYRMVITDASKFADQMGWAGTASLTNHESNGADGPNTCLMSGDAVNSLHNCSNGMSKSSIMTITLRMEESGTVSADGVFAFTPTIARTGGSPTYPNFTDALHSGMISSILINNWSGCFIAGSQVLLENNTTKNIESMVVGDKVIGQDGVINEVKELITLVREDTPIYTINGDIQTSPSHPFLTTTGWKAIDAESADALHPSLNITQLEIGDFVVKTANNGTVSNVEITTLTSVMHEDVTIYNLDVTDSPAGNDTYVVNNYVVHNK